MNPFQFIANFTAEYWYKMFVLLGVVTIFVALLVPVQAISNGSLLTIGLGTFLFGTGEWINHPYTTALYPEIGIKAFGHPRRPHPGGVLLAVLGALITVLGLIAAVCSAFA